MSKKAVCIIGSPKAYGSTAMIVDRIIAGMASVGIEAKRRVIADLDIGFCKGCRECWMAGKCVQHDDMSVLITDLMDADIVVIASPSYWGEVTAQLKAFIDRSLPLCNAADGTTKVTSGKVGVAVAIRAGKDPAENQRLIETIERFYSLLQIRPVARLTVEGVSEVVDLRGRQEKLQEAYELGKSMAQYL